MAFQPLDRVPFNRPERGSTLIYPRFYLPSRPSFLPSSPQLSRQDRGSTPGGDINFYYELFLSLSLVRVVVPTCTGQQ